MENKFTVLKNYFGYDGFREGQEFLIDSILSKKDVVAIMPTGAGKSICFQVPAILFSGITIVVSPLISLMKDQVSGLNQMGVKAAFINSSLTLSQTSKALENARNGVYKIIYVAPERLLTDSFIDFAMNADISMITIDEAHCISQWGQDFRPSYTRINEFIDRLKTRPVVSCFTATATGRVQEDIARQLKLTNYEFLITGFDRKNLYFQVEKPKNKKDALLGFLEDKKDQSGIVYCSTRKDVDSVTEYLVENGYDAKSYHAGLSDSDRHNNQDDFIFDRTSIIVATNAFGMGIDKSNVTYVVHYNMPKDIESYYQEAGRAGRDGSKSLCVMYFSDKDIQTNTFLIEEGFRGGESIDYEILRQIKVEDRTRLKMMVNYCRTTECLRNYVLNYFGEKVSEPCGKCSNCENTYVDKDITIEAQKILSCIVRADERFGTNRIIDILKGSKNKAILDFKLDKLSTYGILQISKDEIKEMVDFLEMNEYIYATNDEYPVLKLGKNSDDILKRRETVIMKSLENREYREDKERKGRKSSKSGDSKVSKNAPINEKMFNILKEVRREIAENEGVPAFMIFHNTTLMEIAKELPTTESQFLDISGVGKMKNDKYGKAFIEAVYAYVNGDEFEEVVAEKELKIEVPVGVVPLTEVTDAINMYLVQKGEKRTTNKRIIEWLTEQGMLEGDYKSYNVLEKGVDVGLNVIEAVSQRGTSYLQIVCNDSATKFVIDSIEEILM